MKNIALSIIGALCVVIFTCQAWSGQSDMEKPSNATATVDRLIQYYSEKADMESRFGLDAPSRISRKLLGYARAHRETIAATLENMKGGTGMERASQVVSRLCQSSDHYRKVRAGSGKGMAIQAIGGEYIDQHTGHRYVRNGDGTYSEFTRRGEFFKKVPAGQPRLATSPYVLPISKRCYLLYSKKKNPASSETRALRAGEPHPEGWSLEKALVAMEPSF